MSEPRIVFADPASPEVRAAFVAAVPEGHRGDIDPVDGADSLAFAGEPGTARARASLWLADGLVGATGRTGMIGHYEAADAEAGVALVRAAVARLLAAGATRVVGPMNGNTWRRYRFELPREPGDPDLRPDGFGSEPRNPARYPDDFAAAGLEVVSRYESRCEPDAQPAPEAHAAARERATARGYRLHALDPARFDETLAAMHALSLDAFAANAWYAPLPREPFLALYAPYRERAVPSLVRLATAPDGTLAGYLFGFPDPLALVDGRPVRGICKTVAVAPAARSAGLGGLLLEDFREACVAFGLRSVLHALMHVDNASMRMSARHHSVIFKRYALFGTSSGA